MNNQQPFQIVQSAGGMHLLYNNDIEQVRAIAQAAFEAGKQAAAVQDVLDMSDSRNWQVGDIVVRTGPNWGGFISGREYMVAKVNAAKQEIYIDRHEGNTTGYTFDLLREGRMFKWLRHGEVQS